MNWKQALLVAVTASLFTGVIASGLQVGPEGDDFSPGVVTSFYPLGFLAKEIARGTTFSVTTLMPPNQEVHSYHPTTRDWLEASRAEVLVYNGAGVDRWFEEELLKDLDTSGKVVVEATAGLPLLDARGHDHGDGEDGEVDPHTWLSPWMALQQGQAIHDAMAAYAPGPVLDATWQALRTRLIALDAEYTTVLANATLDQVIVSHEAYGYLADRYGFTQHGVIGISAEEQPSVAAMTGLVDLMEEEGVYTVFVDPVYSEDYARTVQEELEQRTGEDVRVDRLYFCLGTVDGLDYLEQMEANLDALALALEVPP
jgi:zinc transport system substrate-binding protein